MQETAHSSGSVSHPDLRLIHWHRQYQGTVHSIPLGQARPPVKKMLLSSHYIQHRCIPDPHPRNPAYNSIPPDGKSPHAYRCSDKILHPYIHASGSGNPCHYSSPPDTSSCPDKSSHSKMYSAILSPALQTDP